MDRTERELVRQMRQHMQDPGWGVQGVGGDPETGEPAFLYTVGLWENYGHPEMLIEGMPIRMAHTILNDIGFRVRDDHEQFAPGPNTEIISGGGGEEMRAWLVKVDRTRYRPTFNVMRLVYGGSGFEALQIVWPDTEGRFPWDPGYDQERFPQPVLGTPDTLG